MDDLDRRLITLLRADARQPVAALAQALKVSRATVQNRIDRMTARGEIAGFTVRLHPEAEAGRVRAIMMIAVEGERAMAVQRALRQRPEVASVHTTNGRWDLVAELITPTLAEFSGALDAIRQIEGIGASETSILLKTVAF
ncbi:MAG TPA: Lrp/AsnC family transcriptional regulator [Caulobacteraceae bacterium]|jgi:DNA-binding Lrp family transcriptional regulator|nr:Lrp/AsnC family transcriptional regulator [Caulobacteraceae bacterium]